MEKLRFINFCFTLNNYTDKEIDELKKKGYKYLRFGKEIGENGTPHLQGFIHLHNGRTFKSVMKDMKRWHLEICIGSIQQNIDYTGKEGDIYEFDEKPQISGKRNDLTKIKELAKAGASNIEIYENSSGLQAYRMGLIGKQLYSKKRNFKTKVYWWYGGPGTGKSRTAFETFPNAHWQMTNKWWEGYDEHTEVILDDFREDWFEFSYLLKLLDRYPMTVEIKGGAVNFAPKYLCITTCSKPEDTFSNVGKENLQQLLRRIDEIKFFN